MRKTENNKQKCHENSWHFLNYTICKSLFIFVGVVFLLSCDSPKKSFNEIRDFCGFVFESFKANKIEESTNIWIREKEVVDLIELTLTENDSIKQNQYTQLNRLKKNDVFNCDSLQNDFSNFRNTKSNDFWKQVIYDSVTYNIETWESIQIAEATVFVSYQNHKLRFKIGELILTPNGWKIMVKRGPWWK